MDAGEYFTLTGKERLSYVLKRVNLRKSGYSDSDLQDALFGESAGVKNGKQAHVQKWDTLITDSMHARDKAGQSISDWLDGTVKRLADALKSLRADKKAMEATVAALKPKIVPSDVSVAYQAAKTALQAAITAEAEYTKGGERKELAAKLSAAMGAKINADADFDSAESLYSDIKAEAEKMQARKSCPICLAKGTDWKKEWLKVNAQKQKEMAVKVQAAKKALTAAEANVDAIRKQIATLDKKNAEDKRRTQLEEARIDAEQNLAELESQNTAYQVYKVNTEKCKATQTKLDAAQAEMDVVKHLSDAMAVYQAQVVEKAFGQLLKTVNQFTDGILRSPLVYHEGELRFEFQPEWATRKTFSGTQQMLAYAGLQVALCQDSPVRLVAIDEFGVCPPEWKQKIIQRLLDLVRKEVIDQFIVLDCQQDWLGHLRGKINVIDLG